MIEIQDRPKKSNSAALNCLPIWRQLVLKLNSIPEAIIFIFIWIALLIVGRGQFFRDPGSLWHPIVGQKILASGTLIYSDPFSFTYAGKPWIAQWWLGECLLGLLHELGGLDTILLAAATIIATLYTWIAHRLMARGLHPLLAILVTALTCLASSYHFHPRPHLATIAFMALTFAWLCDFEAGRIPLRRLFWLVPVFIIWTNIHGGMIGGVATLALAVLGWTITWLLGLESPIKRLNQFGALLLLVLICALSALVNPYGLELPRAWFGLMLSPYLPRLIAEHGPLMSSYVGYGVLLFAVFYAIAIIGVKPMQLRVTWILPIIWFGLAWTRVRHGPLFAVTAAIALGDMLLHIRWMAWLARHGSETCVLRPPAQHMAPVRFWASFLVAALVGAALVLQVCNIPFPLIGADRAKPDAKHMPMELLPELQQLARSSPTGTPIFNDMAYGGFLIYYTPELRVFIDDRCELYGDEGLIKYAQAYFEDPEQVERWQKQYGFEIALVATGSNFDRYLQTASNWEVVRKSEPATLYRKKNT